MSKTDNGLKWPKSCFKCFKLVTKSSLPRSSQVFYFESVRKVSNKIWATKHRRRPIIAKRSLSARKVWYAIFVSGEGVALKMPMELGKNITGKYYKDIVLKKSKKYYQKRRPVTGFRPIRLLHGNVPAQCSEIVTSFFEERKSDCYALPPVFLRSCSV